MIIFDQNYVKLENTIMLVESVGKNILDTLENRMFNTYYSIIFQKYRVFLLKFVNFVWIFVGSCILPRVGSCIRVFTGTCTRVVYFRSEFF